MIKKYVMYVFLTLMGLIIWIPLWLLISGSFMPVDEIWQGFGTLFGGTGDVSWPLFPRYPTLRPYVELLFDSPEFLSMFWNSVKLVLIILVGQLVIAMPAAWAFAIYDLPFKKLLFTLYIGLMLMPFQVTMVPNYLVLDQIGILNTRWALILPAVFSTFPVFIMYRFFKSIPRALIEAAEVDGAGPIRTFMIVGVPLGGPGVGAAMVLGFLEYWNMIEQPLVFIKDKSLWPLSLYLPNLTQDKLSISIVASVMMLIPALLIFWWGQSDLEAGVQMSGLKE